TMDVLTQTPYKLIEDIQGVGFKRADEIARATGIAASSPDRVQAAALFVLQESAYTEGNVYLPQKEVTDKALMLLTECGGHLFTEQDVLAAMEAMFQEQKLVWDEERVYLPSLFFAEIGLAKRLRFFSERDDFAEFAASEFYRALGSVEDELGISYAPTQKEAIEKAIESGLMLLTGGPGTGKTTVIRGITRVFAYLHGISLDLKK
ncbi:ATP-dependent RecD-like DNA helicase, partial [Microbacteriaceae bacterium K1510]|nr:ATP-dependent RecD-like DNA helicase [Microbacteriaceae bacterium K1510]